jgi:hypothetical protein
MVAGVSSAVSIVAQLTPAGVSMELWVDLAECATLEEATQAITANTEWWDRQPESERLGRPQKYRAIHRKVIESIVEELA